MVLATIDRIEDGVMVLITHTKSPREIHLPQKLFPRFNEGDVVRLVLSKDKEKKREIERETLEIKKELNYSTLS